MASASLLTLDLQGFVIMSNSTENETQNYIEQDLFNNKMICHLSKQNTTIKLYEFESVQLI